MKTCPRCGQTYTDGDINFCLNDGELLSRTLNKSESSADDPPPTIFMDQPRTTTEGNWQSAPPPATYQSPLPHGTGHAGPMFALPRNKDQTLAIISLSTGIASLTIGWCCSMGLLLSPVAIVTGIIAIFMNRNDPEKYGGKGFAIAGIIVASVFILLYILLMILYGLALFLPPR